MPGTIELATASASAFTSQRTRRPGTSARLSAIQPEPHFDHDLELGDLAVLDEATLIHHLEPIEVPQRLRRLGHGILRRLGVTLLGDPTKLNDLERLVRHDRTSERTE